MLTLEWHPAAASPNVSNLEILAYEPTPLGTLCLRRRELLSRPGTVVTEITLNHEFLMSSYHTESERVFAEIALGLHRADSLSVLIGGLGLGYTAQAVLGSDRVRSIEVVELLPQVLDWLARDLFPLSGTLKADARFRALQDDVYGRLAGPPGTTYDVILIDVDHSPADNLAAANDVFYTRAGLQRAKAHLRPGGVLGVWSAAESRSFEQALGEVFEEVQVESVTFMNTLVDEECTDWLFFARDPNAESGNAAAGSQR